MKKIVFITPVLILALLISGCGLFDPDASIIKGAMNDIKLEFDLSGAESAGYVITRVQVTLVHQTNGNIVEEDLDVDPEHSRASGTINGIKVGVWDLTVRLYEFETEVASGTAEVEVIANQITEVYIKINLHTGGIEIDVDWGDESSVTEINALLEAYDLSMRFVEIIPYSGTDTFREMTLTSYALAVTEVTQGDYETIMGSNPASGYGVGDDYPVYYVNWYNVVEFCNALSSLIGLDPVYSQTTWEADFTKNGFYLPTEAQWEYAAGGPNHFIWSLSNTFNASDYVYNDTQTRPVKSHPANGFGLYDMSGNVIEWCHDWKGEIYPHVGQTDPIGPSNGPERVLRGYSWAWANPVNLQCDYRYGDPPGSIERYSGFRVAVGGFGNW